ncbi:MAG: magnesium transporter [Sedimentisphaerales bacterium]|nr:magnesium transporter [Sedimentisphaerales bacterium]
MAEHTSRELLERIEELIERQDFPALRDVLSEARSSDVAEVVEVVDDITRVILFDLLTPRDAGEVLEKIDEATRSELVEDLPAKNLTDIVATLPPDEAADVIADMTETQSALLLQDIPRPESEQIEKLLTYEEDSAGGIMNPELIRVKVSGTVNDALTAVRKADPEEDFFYVFAVNEQGHYVGTVGLRKMLHSQPDAPVSEVMEQDIPTVNVHADQEEIANLFRKNDLVVAPVVDEKGVLVGRITSDDIIDVMEEEAGEDALVMAGTSPEELETPHLFRAATIRMPWLAVCMGCSMFSALVLYSVYQNYFDPDIWARLVIFVPAIAAMGGNTGLQTSTIVVRGLATGDLAALQILQVFYRESRVALIVAAGCGLLAALLSGASGFIKPVEGLPGQLLGLAVGLAMFFGIMLSTTVGLFLPFIFRRAGIDPAISSGPLVTTANDALGILTYFTLALMMLRWLGS